MPYELLQSGTAVCCKRSCFQFFSSALPAAYTIGCTMHGTLFAGPVTCSACCSTILGQENIALLPHPLLLLFTPAPASSAMSLGCMKEGEHSAATISSNDIFKDAQRNNCRTAQYRTSPLLLLHREILIMQPLTYCLCSTLQ